MATKTTRKNTAPKIEEQVQAQSKNSLVFISHDTRDAEIAEAFSKLLFNISTGVLKSFRSSDKKGTQGMEYGVEWFPEIMKKLDEASDIVCLLTQNSLDRPWILYEAGVAKGKLGTPVLGVALGIPLSNVNSGPFAQFQNCSDDEDALIKLATQLVKRIPNAEPVEEIIIQQVKEFKSKLVALLKQPAKLEIQPKAEKKDDTNVTKLFEEVKIMFQDLPSRIDNRLDSERTRKRRFKFHPMIAEELMQFGKMSGQPGIGFLLILSLFRTELPWIYELGIEVYRSQEAVKTKAEKKKLSNAFSKMLDFSFDHPIIREMLSRPDDYYMLREASHMLRHHFDRLHDFEDAER